MTFTKIEGIMKTLSLFQLEQIPPRVCFEKLFSDLPAWTQKISIRGRPPFAREAVLRALIYQRLRGLPSLSDLAFELENNPSVAAACGFSPSIRDTIDYGSQRFKMIYNQRCSVERGFSRLLAITMQNPTVVGWKATRNHCTIAPITMLLEALAAHHEGFPDKIRYVKSFLPRYLV